MIYSRQLKDQGRKQKVAGVAAILAGLLAQTSGNGYSRGAGHIGIFSGASLIRQGYAKQNEAAIHNSTLIELSAALEAELAPSVIDLEDRSITLSGTVDDQFEEWKRILQAMFEAENGFEAESGLELETQIDAGVETSGFESKVGTSTYAGIDDVNHETKRLDTE